MVIRGRLADMKGELRERRRWLVEEENLRSSAVWEECRWGAAAADEWGREGGWRIGEDREDEEM